MNAWGEVARLTSSDGEIDDDRFGSSVAISGETIIVGAPNDKHPDLRLEPGSAYIFVRSVVGNWVEVAWLVAGDRSNDDFFGSSVALDGDTAIIGTRGRGAYIMTRAGDDEGWGEVAKLTADDGEIENFGVQVSISGDTAVVSAPPGFQLGPGWAYVFRRNEGGADRWGQLARLGGIDAMGFAGSVAISGQTTLVGAPGPQTAQEGLGSAYICPLETVNTVSGACRTAPPLVNDLLVMSDLATACCDGDDFTITATFINTSPDAIRGLFFEVSQLTHLIQPGLTPYLTNADGTAFGRRGATVTPALTDGSLDSGESVTVTFVIRPHSGRPFRFYVNARAAPGS